MDTHGVFTPRHVGSGERLRIPATKAVLDFSGRLDGRWRTLDLGAAGKIKVRRAACGLGCKCDAEHQITE